MRLGIDAREIQNGVYTGIGRALANFLHYFGTLDNGDSCVLFSSRRIPVDFGPNVTNVVINEIQTILWDQIELPQAVRREKIDLLYSPYYKVPLFKSCTTVSAILDLMYLNFKPYYDGMPLPAKLYYKIFGPLYARRADQILTCSVFSKQDIQRIYAVPSEKITVIPLSVGDIYTQEKNIAYIESVKERFSIKGRYFLYVGNFKPHKNVKSIIEAYAAIASLFPDVQLVLAGPQEHAYEDLLSFVRERFLEQRVVFTGKIMESDAPHLLYSGAEAFVMPTLYEGFGLPVIEAMACGVPVIASNTTSIPEVVKDAGILIDPNDSASIAAAMKKILEDPQLKAQLIQKGLAQVQNYDATAIARQTYDFFKKVLSEDQKRTA